MAHLALLTKIIKPVYAAYKITGPGIDPGSSTDTAVSALETIVSSIIGLLSVVGVIYFALQIIFAGYAFLGAQGDPKKIESARDRISQSVLGLFIVLIAIFFASLIATLAGMSGIFNLSSVVNTLTVK